MPVTSRLLLRHATFIQSLPPRLLFGFVSSQLDRPVAVGRRNLSLAQGTHGILVGRHVREALANGEPVVALESTVVTHGLPEPENLQLALQLEKEIASGTWAPAGSSASAVPATVGLIKGQPIVGLNREQIEFLAHKDESRPIKASRRDLALAQANSLSAGTTVSGTMALATSVRVGGASICVFATGGLGGVHQGGQHSMDVSADLYELARSPMGLVAAGFKSFLDARRSLELLETFGCTVASLAQADQLYQAQDSSTIPKTACGDKRAHLFPGFFTGTNQQQAPSPWRCNDIQEAARILFHCLDQSAIERFSLATRRAMLLACPIPRTYDLEQCELNVTQLMEEITQRVELRPNLAGHEKTPLILAELARLTGGRTLEANLALLRNNARIGAHLAYEYASLRQPRGE